MPHLERVISPNLYSEILFGAWFIFLRWKNLYEEIVNRNKFDSLVVCGIYIKLFRVRSQKNCHLLYQIKFCSIICCPVKAVYIFSTNCFLLAGRCLHICYGNFLRVPKKMYTKLHQDVLISMQVIAWTDWQSDRNPNFNSSCHPDFWYTYLYSPLQHVAKV